MSGTAPSQCVNDRKMRWRHVSSTGHTTLPCQGEVTRAARICAFIPTVLFSFCSLCHSLFLPPLLPDIGEKERRALQGQFPLAKRRVKFVFSITIQSWGTGHRVTTGKEIENDRYRMKGDQYSPEQNNQNHQTLVTSR